MTGITDSFLRFGGYDEALGVEIKGAARNFTDVFLDFEAFCKDRAQAQGKSNIVMIAHNAKFDRGMLDGELRRLRSNGGGGEVSLPLSVSQVFDSELDTLKLFKDKRMWHSFTRPTGLQRPEGFKLGQIYHHVFGEPMTNSHNAVGDIRALDRLLMRRDLFYSWHLIANDIQSPFIKVI